MARQKLTRSGTSSSPITALRKVHSITSSARASSFGGTAILSKLVDRLVIED
jgi:hypothetical protein